MKLLVIFFSIIFIAELAFSQDLITLKNGDKLSVVVTKIDKKKVTYKKYNDSDGKLYTIERSQIFIIMFENKNAKYKTVNQTVLDTVSK